MFKPLGPLLLLAVLSGTQPLSQTSVRETGEYQHAFTRTPEHRPAASGQTMSLLDNLLAGKDPRLLIASYARPDFGGPDFRYRLAQAESVAARGPEAFNFAAGSPPVLRVGEIRYPVGSFSTPSLGELKRRISSRRKPGLFKRFKAAPALAPKLSVLLGASPLSDIQYLEAHADGDTLFQLASQFNCLEAPGPSLVPVAAYFDDRTQGPLGVLPLFPGALLRHYAAPGPDGRFIQSPERQIELLADVLLPSAGRIENGYLLSQNLLAPEAFAAKLTQRLDNVRVGLHRDLVVPGSEHHLDQVLTSTLAGGGYSHSDTRREPWLTIQRQLLRAAYLGTLLAAAESGHGKVVLTAIGGGVFANPHELIWEALLWALDEIIPYLETPLHVIFNPRSFDLPPEQLAAEARKRHGVMIRF